VKVLPKANHLLLEEGSTSFEFVPGFLDTISAWLSDQTH
jgi:hypothetical protein